MRIKNIVIALCLTSALSVSAGINFGSGDSAVVVLDGSLNLGCATLENGSLRDLQGGSIVNNEMYCSGMTISEWDGCKQEMKKKVVDGSVWVNDTITLFDGQTLTLAGGTCQESIYLNQGSNALVEGHGKLTSNISVNSGAQLTMRFASQLNQDISLYVEDEDTTTLKLEQDLVFTPGYSITTEFGSYGGICSLCCNGYRVVLGGDYANETVLPGSLDVHHGAIEFRGPVTLQNCGSLNLHYNAMFEGNGHALVFGDSSSTLYTTDSCATVSMNNVVFNNVSCSSFSGNGTWDLNNCRIENCTSSIQVHGALYGCDSAPDIFGCNGAAFQSSSLNKATIELNQNTSIHGCWSFLNDYKLIGDTNVLHFGCESSLDLGSSTLSLESITLKNLSSNSINNSNGCSVNFSDTTLIDTYGRSFNITGFQCAPASVTLAESETAGDLLCSDLTFTAKSRITLLTDLSLNGTWYFNEDAVIDGGGHMLDLSNGGIAVADGSVVEFVNVILNGVNDSSLMRDEVYIGSFIFQNVTIALGGANVTWDSSIDVNGPLTIVTGSYMFYGNSMSVNGGTVFYDTLGTPDNDNVQVDSLNGGGRLLFVGNADQATGIISISGDTSLNENLYLYNQSNENIRSLVIQCTNSATYNGYGRSIVFPYSDGNGTSTVITVNPGQTLTTTNMVLEGLVPSQHITSGDVGFFVMGNDTLIRLHQDISLYTPLYFGSGASYEYMILDLNGHTIDAANGGILLNSSGGGSTLVIRNGRLTNMASGLLQVTGCGTIVLENIEFSLSGDFWFNTGSIHIRGNSILNGVSGSAFVYNTCDSFRIEANSKFSIMDGLTYSHSTSSHFRFCDSTSQLELVGGSFRHPDCTESALSLHGGMLLLDHKSYMYPGSYGITLSSSLAVEIRPGANLTIGVTGDLSCQTASAGTVTYSNC